MSRPMFWNRDILVMSGEEPDRADVDELIAGMEGCREYLYLVARRLLARDLRVKEPPSDLVQETLIAAWRRAGRWKGRAAVDAELRAWLRRFLMHQIAHAARRHRGTAKRRLAREVPLAAIDADPATPDALIADGPSAVTRLIREEEEAAMHAALARLPGPMRQAVLWRHHEDCTFNEIGRRLDCSSVAARKIWLKALQRLQDELQADLGDRD